MAVSGIRRGWLVVFYAFTIVAISLPSRALIMVTLTKWQEEFECTRSAVALGKTVMLAIMGIGSVLAGQAADTMGPQKVICAGIAGLGASFFCVGFFMDSLWSFFLFYGVLPGIGHSLLNLNIFAAVAIKFMPPHLHGIAMGTNNAGGTVGQFIMTPSFALVVRDFGWRVGYVALGAILFALLPGAWMLLKPDRPHELRLHPISRTDQQTGTTTVTSPAQGEDMGEASKNKSGANTMRAKLIRLHSSKDFLILLWAFFVCGITVTGLIETHVIAFGEDQGHSNLLGSMVFSVLNAVNGTFVVVVGWASDRMNRPQLLTFLYSLRGFVFALAATGYTKSVPVFFLFGIAYGICGYSVVAPTFGLVAAHFGKDCMGLGGGVLLCWHALGGGLGAFLGGLSVDLYGSYTPVFTFAALALILNAALLFGGVSEIENQSSPISTKQDGTCSESPSLPDMTLGNVGPAVVGLDDLVAATPWPTSTRGELPANTFGHVCPAVIDLDDLVASTPWPAGTRREEIARLDDVDLALDPKVEPGVLDPVEMHGAKAK